MKKLLALLIILSMVSIAGATVLKVVPVDVGLSNGRLGTDDPQDMLRESDTIGLKVIIENNPYPGGNTAGDGYWISMIDLDLEVTGPASLAIGPGDWGPILYAHANIAPFNYSDVVDNAIDHMAGIAQNPAGPGEADLIWNLLLHCDGEGDVGINLTLHGLTQYADYFSGPTGGVFEWVDMTEGDLGDLTIYQVPEPMTVALLGLGGLFLLRRRK